MVTLESIFKTKETKISKDPTAQQRIKEFVMKNAPVTKSTVVKKKRRKSRSRKTPTTLQEVFTPEPEVKKVMTVKPITPVESETKSKSKTLTPSQTISNRKRIVSAMYPKPEVRKKQIDSFNYLTQPKQVLTTLAITPTKQKSSYRKLEDSLYNEYTRIRNKPLNQRTNKEMALISLYGGSSAALGTIRKIPQATWNLILATLRPGQIIKGIYNIATDSGVRKELDKSITRFGAELQRGDPNAVSTLLSEIGAQGVFGKGVTSTVKLAKQSRKLSPYYTKVDEWQGGTAQEMGTSRALIDATKNKNLKAYSVSTAKIKDLFDNKGFLEVKNMGGQGLDRQFYWAEKYLPELGKLKLGGKQPFTKSQIIDRLKAKGFTDKKIEQLRSKSVEDHFYFGNNQVYSYYTPPKGGTILVVEPKGLLKFPPALRTRINNVSNLSAKQKTKLRGDINTWAKRNKDKLVLSPRTLAKGFGEFELALPVGSKLQRLNNLRTFAYGLLTVKKGTRFTYLKQVDRFVEIADAVIGANKLTKPTLKMMFKDLGSKLKTKYSPTTMKKDISTWVKQRTTKAGKKQREQDKLKVSKTEKEFIAKQIDAIKKDKGLSKKVKDKRINEWRNVRNGNRPMRSIKFKRYARPVKPRPVKDGRTPKSGRTPSTRTPSTRKPTGGRTPKTGRTPPARTPPTRKPSTGRTPKGGRTPPARPVQPKTPKTPKVFGFNNKAYNNKILLVQGVYRERKNRNAPAGKKNPVVTKVLNIKDTKNRALKRIGELADKRTVRSITTKIVGVTDKKVKDIKTPKVLTKFSQKKSKNTPVLKLVEKTKYISDTKGEKRELRQSKARVNVKVVSKLKKTKKSSRKSKSIKVKKSKK